MIKLHCYFIAQSSCFYVPFYLNCMLSFYISHCIHRPFYHVARITLALHCSRIHFVSIVSDWNILTLLLCVIICYCIGAEHLVDCSVLNGKEQFRTIRWLFWVWYNFSSSEHFRYLLWTKLYLISIAWMEFGWEMSWSPPFKLWWPEVSFEKAMNWKFRLMF